MIGLGMMGQIHLQRRDAHVAVLCGVKVGACPALARGAGATNPIHGFAAWARLREHLFSRMAAAQAGHLWRFQLVRRQIGDVHVEQKRGRFGGTAFALFGHGPKQLLHHLRGGLRGSVQVEPALFHLAERHAGYAKQIRLHGGAHGAAVDGVVSHVGTVVDAGDHEIWFLREQARERYVNAIGWGACDVAKACGWAVQAFVHIKRRIQRERIALGAVVVLRCNHLDGGDFWETAHGFIQSHNPVGLIAIVVGNQYFHKCHFRESCMHAWICSEPTGVEALKWQEMPTPQPKAGEVLIEIAAASLNFPDLLIVQNKYQFKPALPFVPGSEYAGVVRALGEGVSHLQVGQHVACLSGTGGFATHTCAPAALCMPLPKGFPFADAAAFIMIYGTSHHALLDRAQLKAGETVLILGAAGGVGTAAIQIAKKVGATVVAAASSDEKCATAKALGADATINYSTHAPSGTMREAIKAATGGKGPDVIYDAVGGEFAEPAFRSIAWRGRYLVVGFASSPEVPRLPMNLPLLKGASLVGVFWGDFAKREPAANAAMMGELAHWYGQGQIKPSIDAQMPMKDLKSAYERMAARKVQGKLVLVN